MRILFLDDQSEILDVFRLVCNPALLKPRAEPENLFDNDSLPAEDGGFEPVLDVEFKGSFFLKAGEAVEAFRKMRNSPARFQIAVLDMQLPESSGLEVAAELLNLDPEINLVFVTAYSDWSVHDIAKELGRDQTQFMFLKKPFELQEVLQILIYIHEKLLQEKWHQESLRNLVNFTRSYKTESLQIFDTLLSLKTVDLVKDLARQKIPELIRKNEKVLELVEMILTDDTSGANKTFLLEELLEEFKAQERVDLQYSEAAFQNIRLVGNGRYISFALSCLVNNGLDFSTDVVTVSAHVKDSGMAEIMVLDKGAGIQRQYQNEIFEPGFKLSQQSTKAGFGLSLVKKVFLTLHTTDLAIKSAQSKGTIIRFTLPCKSVA